MSWLVACTQPQAEARVVERIRDSGFDVFFPRIRRKVMHRGRRVYRTDPLFPSYAMVRHCDNFSNLFELRRGQFNVIMQPDSDLPALVPDKKIDEIRSVLNDDILQLSESRFKPGQKVRAKEGALADLVGSFLKSATNREVALFAMLGRSVEVSFKRGELQAA